MKIKEAINKIVDIKIQDDTNGSEAWIAVNVENVRSNSKIGKELIEIGFRKDAYYEGLIYSVCGNLKEKYAKAQELQNLLESNGIHSTILDRGL